MRQLFEDKDYYTGWPDWVLFRMRIAQGSNNIIEVMFFDNTNDIKRNIET